MNNLASLYAAHLSQKNIYDDVKNFQTQDNHSPNFSKVIEWLQESMEAQNCSHIDEVITTLLMKIPDDDRLILEATKGAARGGAEGAQAPPLAIRILMFIS